MREVPRFFIDTSDQRHFIRDEEGAEYEDVEAAVDALPDMARDELPNGDARSFLAIVRDEEGRTLVHASMNFAVTWLNACGDNDTHGALRR